MVHFEKCLYIINQQKYVLTPDFALKLLIIHERLKAGQAVILSGDTVRDFFVFAIVLQSINVPLGYWKD